MKSLLLLTALAIVTAAASSQIRLTKEDYSRFFSATSVETYTAVNIENARLYVGYPGGQNLYDMNGISFQNNGGECSYVNPATTPFANRFPTSTHGLCQKVFDGTNMTFYRLTDDALYYNGDGRLMDGIMYVYSAGVNRPIIKFPAQVGTSWEFAGEVQNFGPGATTQTISRYTFDANGMLGLGFDQQECLRLKTVDELITENNFNGQMDRSVRRSITYTFITAQGLIFEAAIDTVDENIENPRLIWMRYTKHNLGPVGVNDLPSTASIALAQNYPNPVSAASGYVTTLSWNLASPSQVSIALYNLAGKKEHLIYEGFSPAGKTSVRFDAGNLNAGLYVVRMTAGGTSQIKTLSVVK